MQQKILNKKKCWISIIKSQNMTWIESTDLVYCYSATPIKELWKETTDPAGLWTRLLIRRTVTAADVDKCCAAVVAWPRGFVHSGIGLAGRMRNSLLSKMAVLFLLANPRALGCHYRVDNDWFFPPQDKSPTSDTKMFEIQLIFNWIFITTNAWYYLQIEESISPFWPEETLPRKIAIRHITRGNARFNVCSRGQANDDWLGTEVTSRSLRTALALVARITSVESRVAKIPLNFDIFFFSNIFIDNKFTRFI